VSGILSAFTIVARDALLVESTNPYTVNVLVTAVNDAPTVAITIPNQNATQGSLFSYTVPTNTFTDVDIGDSLSYSALKGDGITLLSSTWLSFNTTTRILSGTPTNSDVGTLAVIIRATDLSGSTADASFNIVVANLNDLPTLAITIPNQNATQGSLFSYTVPTNTFDDVDIGDSLSYSALKGDGITLLSSTWLSFNTTTRILNGTPTNSDVGTLAVIIRATDLSGSTADASFNIVVANLNDAPTMSIMTKNLLKYDTSCNGVTDAADIDQNTTFTTTITSSSAGTYGSLTIVSSPLTTWRYDLSSNSYAFRMLQTNVTATDTFTIKVSDNGSPAKFVEKTLTITVTGIANPQQLSGKIIDGYIKFGTINVRDLANNLMAGPVQTDALGNYSIIIPVSIPPTSYIIDCVGGIDIATNLPLIYPLKTLYTPIVNSVDYSVINSSNIFLTPLTTIVANIVTSTATNGGSINGSSNANAISIAITAATSRVATALDISVNVVSSDYIAITDIKVAAAAIKISTITSIISKLETINAATVLSNISTFIQQSSGKITLDNVFVTAAGGQAPITNLTLLVTTIVSEIDTSATLDSIYTKSIAGTTVASITNATFISYTTPQLIDAITTATTASSPGVISNICFKAGTKVITDQGIVNIEKITDQHSIRGKKVLLVSNTTNIDDYMVKIEKGALYENVPNTDTWLTGEHKVFFNKEMIKSKNLVNGGTIVKENKISEVVYNLLLEGDTSGKMIANGMISETLSPKSVMVQLLVKLNKLSDKDRERDIIRINKLMCEEKERMKLGTIRRL
jgi:VCBS repeat-containing protein